MMEVAGMDASELMEAMQGADPDAEVIVCLEVPAASPEDEGGPLLFAEAAASSAEPYPGDTGRLLIHAHMALGELASQAIGPSSLRELADALEREADAMEREMDVDGTEGILI